MSPTELAAEIRHHLPEGAMLSCHQALDQLVRMASALSTLSREVNVGLGRGDPTSKSNALHRMHAVIKEAMP